MQDLSHQKELHSPRPGANMRTPRSLLLAGLCVTATLAPALSGCGSDGGGTGPNGGGGGTNPALHATWNATSFGVLGVGDLIANGMTMVVTLAPGGTYTISFTNDVVGLCDPDPGPDCTFTGTYSSTASTLTLDPGTIDETTFNYTIVGTTVTLTGTIDGAAVTIVLQKV
jgi:hypothetical protein